MSNYNFDEEIQRHGTGSVKWEYMWQGPELVFGDWSHPKHGDQRTLPLWVADMDFRCPQVVIDAIKERADHGIFGYTIPNDSYFEAFIDWSKTHYEWEIKQEWIKIVSGVVPALNMLVKMLTEPGQNVLMQGPVYYHFMNSSENNGRNPISSTLLYDKESGRYTMDFADLAKKAADPNTTMAILCSPHNPVSRVWTADELRQFGDICIANNVTIISDEIHSDLIFDGHTFIPFASLSEEFAQHSITCMAPSKTFNMAGLKTSNVVIPNDDLREQFADSRSRKAGLFAGGSTFGVTATEAAYRGGRPWLNAVMSYVQENYAFMCDYIAQNMPDIKVVPAEGTYLIWLDCSGLGMTSADRKKLILEDAKVYLDDGPMFGPAGDDFERFNIACPRHILAESLERIKAQLDKR